MSVTFSFSKLDFLLNFSFITELSLHRDIVAFSVDMAIKYILLLVKLTRYGSFVANATVL